MAVQPKAGLAIFINIRAIFGALSTALSLRYKKAIIVVRKYIRMGGKIVADVVIKG